MCRARGHVETSVVESVDLMVTLADLAGLPLPKQALGGETLRPLLLTKQGLAAQVSWCFLTVQASSSGSVRNAENELMPAVFFVNGGSDGLRNVDAERRLLRRVRRTGH